jgi:hypothetical protein
MDPREARETKSAALRDSQDTNEGRRRQDDALPDPQDQKPIQFPTWRFAEDGRTAIVTSPQELEELEADGGNWQDAPHPAPTEFVPGANRTFASPVGTVDPLGAASRLDKPAMEIGLTTPLPANVAGSVPQGEVDVRRGQAASTQGVGLSSGMQAEQKRMEAEIERLRRENEQLKAQASQPKGGAKKAAAKGKSKSKGKGQDVDARATARDEAREKAEAKARDDADAQSRVHAQG